MSTEITRRGASIAPALAEAGVQIVEQDGARVVHFPVELRQRFTVLQPVTALVASDPLWSPSVRIVQLADEHLYPGSKRDTRGIAKAGITLIADAAGISVDRLEPIEPRLLRPSEIGWNAWISIRRSDGTRATFTDAKVIDVDDEREAIEAQVLNYASRDAENGNPWPQTKVDARVRERWIKEKPHLHSKCQTKAILRVMRLCLQIPQELPVASIAKPILVVGWSMTPDYDDPDTRRLLLEAGVSATARAYGPASSRSSVASVSPAPDTGATPELEASSDVIEAQAEQTFDPATEPPPAVVTPPPAGRGSGGDAAKWAEAARFPIAIGKHKGKTIGQLAEEADGRQYLAWLNGREATTHDGRMLKAMISTFLQLERAT